MLKDVHHSAVYNTINMEITQMAKREFRQHQT